jgi:hypothetical protein
MVGTGESTFHQESAMCHPWEYELIKKAYLEEAQRRRNEEAAQRDAPVSVPRPFDPQPQVKIKTPIPA